VTATAVGWGLEPWLWWPGLALLGALLALDENGLAQTWFSQPLPACLLAGLWAGEPAAGLAVGLMLQLALIGNLPVGAAFRVDTVSAGAGVTAGAILAGWQAPDLRALWAVEPAGEAARLGWLLAVIAVASLAGGRLVHLERRACLGRMLDGYRSVRDGDLGRLERLHGRCLLMTGLRGGLLTPAWALAIGLVWHLGPQRLPPALGQAFGLLPLLVPLLAAGSLLERFGHRRSLPLVAACAAGGFLAARWIF
jgi:hypothetical protein